MRPRLTKHRRRVRLVHLSLAIAVIAAACSTGGGGTSASDQFLRYAVQMETQLSGHLDPAESTNGCDNIVLHWIYGSLTDIDADGNPVPGLAESWELEGRVFTLHLRPGLTFHDGSTFDAEAVKKGIEYLKQGEQTGEALRVVDEVEVVQNQRRRVVGELAKLADEGVEYRVARRRGAGGGRQVSRSRRGVALAPPIRGAAAPRPDLAQGARQCTAASRWRVSIA